MARPPRQCAVATGPGRRDAAARVARPTPRRRRRRDARDRTGRLTLTPPADGGGVRRPTGGPPAALQIAVKCCADRHLRPTPAASAKNEVYPRAKSRPGCLVPRLHPYVLPPLARRPACACHRSGPASLEQCRTLHHATHQ